MKVAKVFLRQASPVYDKIYSYAITDELSTLIEVGMRVLIPFGSRNKLQEAFVFSIESSEADGMSLKQIFSCLDEKALIKPHQLKLISQMKLRYGSTYGQIAQLMLPPGLKLQVREYVSLKQKDSLEIDPELLSLFSKESTVAIDDLILAGWTRSQLYHLENKGILQITSKAKDKTSREMLEFCKLIDKDTALALLEDQALGSIQQESAIRYLLEECEAEVQDLLQICDIKRNSLKTLEKKGLVELYKKPFTEVRAIEESKTGVDYLPTALTEVHEDMLTHGQKEALKVIEQALAKDDRSREEFLMFGVTGSGKTEVYMRAAKSCLEQGKSTIILVPEISLTPQMTAQFERRFPNEVIVLHSRLSPRERFNRWERVYLGQAKIVLGARSAIFSPLENLGLIIIDEEQEDSYQSEMNPRYHATTVARIRQLNENCLLVLGSATPSLESYQRTFEKKSTLLRLGERTGTATLPQTHIIDLRRFWNAKTEGLLSEALVSAMQDALAKNEQVLLFLNRRGYAANYLCKSCGKTVECPHCSIGMTYHKNRKRLVCHYCGLISHLPQVCPECGEEDLHLHGIGTQKLEEVCREQFPDVKIIRMDQDQTSGRDAHAKLLKEFRDAGPSILIGTQMIAKGHDFPRLTVVGIVAADQLIGLNDIRASEKAFQLITQTAGRAGRKDLAGQVFIQAFDVDHYAIQTASRHDYLAFVDQEFAFREALHYPPFSNRALLLISADSETKARQEAKTIESYLENLKAVQSLGNLHFLPAVQSPLYKVQGRWRWQILFSAPKQDGIRQLSMLWQRLSLQKREKNVRLSFTLDPA